MLVEIGHSSQVVREKLGLVAQFVDLHLPEVAPLRPLGVEQLAQRVDLREELAQPHPAVARVAITLLDGAQLHF